MTIYPWETCACICFIGLLCFACTKSSPPASTTTEATRVWTIEQATTPAGVKKCACGDYPVTYQFYVKEGTGCCTGPVMTEWPAKKLVYAAEGNKGTWKLINEEKMEALVVQRNCCPE